jgi:diguanylate cyclase (GGDEF)-like protein
MANHEQLANVLSEFARTMVTEFAIQDILDALAGRIVEIMPVTAAGVTLIGSDEEPPRYVAASSASALRFEEVQTSLHQGPCVTAFRTNEAVLVPDLRIDERFGRFAPQALDTGLVAVFAFPLRHGTHSPIGALDLYRGTPGALDAGTLEAAQTLADVAAAYVLNAQSRQDLEESAERFRTTSLHDALTGLPNRVLFGRLLDHAASRTRRSGKRLAVLFADLDRFKEVNDLFGHHVGDELLVAVAQRLRHLLRTGDTLARLAGDEFVVLCEDLDATGDTEVLAARIDAGLKQPFTLSGRTLHVSASVGIAFAGIGDDVPGDLLRDADAAMYQAKRRGGGRYQVLDLRERDQAANRATLSQDVHGVLERGELAAHFQPVVDAHDGRVVGLEALARWTHPTRGPVSPTTLVALAEESHLICDVGRWVFEHACRSSQDVQRGPGTADALQLAVNASPHELLSCRYAEMVAEVLAETGTHPGDVTIEVTENAFILDPARALLAMEDLKAVGVQLALDDFGTGYSSLSYLQNFPVDVLKIDRSFVTRHDRTSRAIVAAVVDLAHELGMTVIAEGVETEAQRDAVAGLACEAYQGYWFARPMPASDLTAFLGARALGTSPGRDPNARSWSPISGRAPTLGASLPEI